MTGYRLRCYFAPFISAEFENFLLVEMMLLSLPELADFITTCAPRTLHESIGSRKYDAHRQAIIDLKIIWHFIQQTFWHGQAATERYNAFMNLREKKLVRTTVLFPHSEVLTLPASVYRPPQMVFPEYELSNSEHGERNHKPSRSSLYRDRFAEHTSHYYVPPHGKSPNSSKHENGDQEQFELFDLTIDHAIQEESMMDAQDSEEELESILSEEELRSTFFNEMSSPTEQIYTEDLSPVNKGSVSLLDPYYKKNESHFDTSVDLRDHFSGYYSQLNLWRYNTPIVASSTFVPRRRKEDYNNTWYLCNHFPPAKSSKVELPTREKKTEPVQDPVPRVKGIRGTPTQIQHNQTKRSLAPNVRLKGSSRAKSQLRHSHTSSEWSLLSLLVFIVDWHVNGLKQSHKWKKYRRYRSLPESLVSHGHRY